MKRKLIVQSAIALASVTFMSAQNAAYDQNGPSPIGGGNSSGFGFQALFNNLGADNSALGHSALYSNTAGSENTAAGFAALYSNSQGKQNSAFGRYSLFNNVSGSENVAIGNEALFSSSLRSSLVGVGFQALYGNIYGNYNTAIGYQSQFNSYEGSYNTSTGIHTLYNNSIGSQNTADGSYALYGNIGGLQNTAVGAEALYTNNSSYNSAVGVRALYHNYSGKENTALGVQALHHNNVGSFNTAVGMQALQAGNNTGNEYNTALGWKALVANQTGADNTSVGAKSGMNNLVGWGNTYLGANADGSMGGWVNSTAIGYQASVNNNNKVRIGNAAVTVIEGAVAFTPSDSRFKTNVSEADVKGLDFIKRLRPVVYNFDAKKFTEFLTSSMPDSIRKNYLKEDFRPATEIRQSGFLAQEVEKAAEESGYSFNGLHKPEHKNDNYSIAYAQFVVPLVKAVQEQQEMIEKQKSESQLQMADLQKQLEEQKQLIKTLSQKTTAIASADVDMLGFYMAQNEPNPFSYETVVKYTLPQNTASAVMVVYDLTGKQITKFGITEKGSSEIMITAEKLSAGIYIYSIVADGKVIDSKRMIVSEK